MSQLSLQQALELGLEHQHAGRVDVAESIYRQILSQHPDQPDALHLLGVLASSIGQYRVAAELIERAIQRNPRNAAYHSNLGLVMTSLNQPDAAMQALRNALALNPNLPEAHNNLGHLYILKGQLDLAIQHVRRAIELAPQYLQAHCNLATAMEKLRDLDGAIEVYRTIIRLKPDYADAYNNLANVLSDRANLDESIDCLRRAILIQPGLAVAHSNLLFNLQFHPDYGPQRLFDEHREWNRLHAEPVKGSILPHNNNRDPDRRLRVGHVSPEFRFHCQALFTTPLLSNHDHKHFEIHCYSDVARPDATTEQLKANADGWHDIAGMSDADVAKLVRADGIDILVDHAMHMNNGRPLLFARRAAPVQVAWLAYPGSTGLAAMDYRLTDPQLDPSRESDAFYSEKSIRLPHTFWCYDPLASEPAVNPLPAESNGFITFGCLNNFRKLNAQTLRLWAKVLQSVPNSRLLLLAPSGSCREWARRELGSASDRVEFVAHQPRAEYLRVYHRIDIALDTMPYNGHTTSFDSLWMGVPVVTITGETAPSRGGLSLLTNLGLTELVAGDADGYVKIARELASDTGRLSELRRTLRERMQASPLMDGPRFARDFEAALRQMWRDWCQTRKDGSNQP